TSDVGAFLIVSESSAAAGVRRIEAVTGRGAYALIARRFKALKQAASILKTTPEEVPNRAEILQQELASARKQVAALKAQLALSSFGTFLGQVETINDVRLLAVQMDGLDRETLARLADKFRERYPHQGVCAIVSTVEGEAIVMTTVTYDLIQRGLKAGELASHISRQLGAGGGGAPHLAFGGGKTIEKVPQALASVRAWVAEKTS
ncbi:MAG: DHHA1 domain-containing protein, partial [Anaerolineales bacterium]|nr:DHHA1 domain-containing protein [Anaerolineales bacterium]